MTNNESITLGGGCFWCMEAIFQRVSGVISVTSGYSGGTKENPTMEEVYAGGTGHAEVVDIVFDNTKVTLRELLEIFFTLHDPTTLNRQGNDVGDEYRSVIFYRNPDQQMIAQEMIEHFAPTVWEDPVVTEVLPFKKFWPAGEDQYDFYNNHPEAAYCQVVINPKVDKLKDKFGSKLAL